MSDELVPVIAAVIRRDERYLLGRRPAEKRHGGLWEFPGGKVHPAESMLDAAKRELEEELSLTAEAIGATLFSAPDEGSRFVIDFVEVIATGTPVAHEHTELNWFAVSDLLEMPLAPADALFAQHLAAEPPPTTPSEGPRNGPSESRS